MYKSGEFSSLFDHLGKEEKDYYDGTFAPSKMLKVIGHSLMNHLRIC